MSYTPDLIIVGGVGGGVGSPNAPLMVSIAQASGIIVVGVRQNPISGNWPVATFNLYRAPSSTGPFVKVGSGPISLYALQTFLLDNAPVYGQEEWYAASAVDTVGNESQLSAPVPYSAFNPNATATTSGLQVASISPSAYGPYPLLGQDVFLDPLTQEGVIGPNGDLLTVNGLECWAQDLRIRMLTEKGQILLHPDFGLSRGKVIGSGQARPVAQALILRTKIIDAILADPRTYEVQNVIIQEYDAYSWIVGYQAIAIGVEDPLKANLVYPYYLAA